MPIYSYCCRGCGEEFDKLRSMSERDEALDCPQCGKREVDRAVARFGVGGSSSGACSVQAPRGST